MRDFAFHSLPFPYMFVDKLKGKAFGCVKDFLFSRFLITLRTVGRLTDQRTERSGVSTESFYFLTIEFSLCPWCFGAR